VSEEGQACKAVVTSFDWGAFGLLEAAAELENGATVRAFVKGEPRRRELRLPKSRDDSWIAESWRRRMDAAGADDSDDEEDPPGDGLALFEEYRGLRVEGWRISAFPKKKDFFAVDTVGGRTQEAFRRFAALSGLQVHFRLREDEIDRERVVNPHGGQGPHLVDQHAIVVRLHGATDYCEARGGPSTPKGIEYVGLSPEFAGPADADYWIMAAVHEFFHCVDVWHHGDRDQAQGWTRKQDAAGAWKRYRTSRLVGEDWVPDDGAEIRIFHEPGTPARLGPPAAEFEVHVGFAHGQHSGLEDCVMRYDIANVARHADGRHFFVSPKPRKMGHALCDQVLGVAFNADPRPEGEPWLSRFRGADSAAQRGRCARQITVNDAVKAKTR
jgi:hypothetical protein